MATLRSLLGLLLVAVSGWCSSETLVPFIAWSSGDGLSAVSSKPPATVDDLLRDATLDDIEVFVVFRTSELSFDDIAKFGGVYGEKNSALASLQSQLQTSKSSVWTGMQDEPASNLVSALAFNYDLIPKRVLGREGVALDGGSKQLIVVVLTGSDSEEGVFAQQDLIISQVMAAVSDSKKSYAAFYTADHTSLPSPSEPETHVFQSKRDATNNIYGDYDSSPGPVVNGSTTCALVSKVNASSNDANGGRCIMMCVKFPIYRVEISGRNGAIVNRHNMTKASSIQFLEGSCLRQSGNESRICQGEDAPFFRLQATFDSFDFAETLNFTFRFIQGSKEANCSVSSGFWEIDLEVNGTRYVRNTRSKIGSKLQVPIGASYACGENDRNVYREPKSDDNSTDNVFGYQFSGLQAQVSGVFTQTSFASAYNCEGYFTHVSLMGIFSVIILLLILYCSTVFMFQMKSVDRFDDPRGPTITVENLH